MVATVHQVQQITAFFFTHFSVVLSFPITPLLSFCQSPPISLHLSPTSCLTDLVSYWKLSNVTAGRILLNEQGIAAMLHFPLAATIYNRCELKCCRQTATQHRRSHTSSISAGLERGCMPTFVCVIERIGKIRKCVCVSCRAVPIVHVCELAQCTVGAIEAILLQLLWPSGDILPKGSLTIQSFLTTVCLPI